MKGVVLLELGQECLLNLQTGMTTGLDLDGPELVQGPFQDRLQLLPSADHDVGMVNTGGRMGTLGEEVPDDAVRQVVSRLIASLNGDHADRKQADFQQTEVFLVAGAHVGKSNPPIVVHMCMQFGCRTVLLGGLALCSRIHSSQNVLANDFLHYLLLLQV